MPLRMALVSSIGQRFMSYFSPRKSTEDSTYNAALEALTHPDETSSVGESGYNADTENRANSSVDGEDIFDLEGDTLLSPRSIRKRRRTEWDFEAKTQKRQKVIRGHYEPEHRQSSDLEGQTMVTYTPPLPGAQRHLQSTKRESASALMPPPATPRLKRPGKHQKSVGDNGSDIASLAASTLGRTEPEKLDDYDIEKARRYAEAIDLPPKSGVWSHAEKDLFSHLALRGFEPLLPKNWMNDFKTLPLSLYATNDIEIPLMQSNLLREFHAIRALRDLFDLGNIARGGSFSQNRQWPELKIQKRIENFITWALKDVNMHSSQRPNLIPVHTVTAMKTGQSTQEAIQDLAASLHTLARRWRQACDIRESIEIGGHELTLTSNDNEDTRVVDSDDEEELPILYGVLICSTIIMIVTMNSHHAASSAKMGKPFDHEADSSSGLRLIATFDFSNKGQDVWNALAIVILVMCIRQTMLNQFEVAVESGQAESGSMWELVKRKKSPTSYPRPSRLSSGVQMGFGRAPGTGREGGATVVDDELEDPDA